MVILLSPMSGGKRVKGWIADDVSSSEAKPESTEGAAVRRPSEGVLMHLTGGASPRPCEDVTAWRRTMSSGAMDLQTLRIGAV
jgi:hypothetical protein